MSFFNVDFQTRYEAYGAQTRKRIYQLQMCKSWSVVSRKNGVTLSKRSIKGSKYEMFKSSMILPKTSLSCGMDYIKYEMRPLHESDFKTIKARDKYALERKKLQTFQSTEKKKRYVVYSRNTSGTRLVSDREFVYYTDVNCYSNGTVILSSQSLKESDDHLVKTKSGVRAKIFMGLIIKPVNRGWEISWILSLHPKGYILPYFFNSAFGASVFDLCERGKRDFQIMNSKRMQ